MDESIEEEIRQMLEAITINTAFPRYVEDLEILLEDTFYFDICQRIFPSLKIKIIKITENKVLTSAQKMQQLINLLQKKLQIDLSEIKGEGIMEGYLDQIHFFLSILWKCSEEEFSKSSSSMRVQSEKVSYEENEMQPYPHSARDRNNQKQAFEKKSSYEEKEEEMGEEIDDSAGQSRKAYNVSLKKRRNQIQERQNVYQSTLNIMLNEKNRKNQSLKRDNRKKKNSQIEQAKNKYKSYLKNYAKETKAKRNKEMLKNMKKSHKANFQLPPEDFEKVDNFFQSFAYKFRDQKQNFLRRIKNICRKQELDRMCQIKRIEREKNKQVELGTKKQMERINNEHQMRSQLLKEKLNSDKQCIKIMKKEYEKFLRIQKKQMKEQKKKQLNLIKDTIAQENQRCFMEFEEGGRIQQIILDMYKRY